MNQDSSDLWVADRARSIYPDDRPGDRFGGWAIDAWRGPGGPPPTAGRAGGDVVIWLVEGGPLRVLYHGQLIGLRPGQVVVCWAALPHLLHLKAACCLGWQATLPADALASGWLPPSLALGLLQGRALLVSEGPEAVPEGPGTLGRDQVLAWYHGTRSPRREVRAASWRDVDAWLGLMARWMADAEATAPARLVRRDRLAAIVAMARYLAARFRGPVQVADVARAAPTHPQHAMRLFRSFLGSTIVEYLTRCRVAEAQRLLVSTEQQVSAVALHAGFGSVSQFYDCFSRICQVTPRDYRLTARRELYR